MPSEQQPSTGGTRKKRRTRRSQHPEGLKDPLLFVDTNILLDYYRARNEMQLGLLKRLEDVSGRLILTYQVEMEFKKQRQNVVVTEGLEPLKQVTQFSPPAFLAKSKAAETTKKNLKDATDRVKRMRKRVTDAIRQPTAKDPVYQSVQRLFQVDSEFNLCRLNKELYKNADRIRRLALKRWMLGYPPRKRNDTSIGDAVNWEWIVDCASRVKRDVVIVSRDSDYGVTVDGESFLNDWLLAEFRDRVTMHSQVRLTEKLAKALSWLEVKVTEAERESEEKLLRTTDVGDIRDDWAMPKLEVTESEFREFLRKIARTSKFIYDASSTKSPGDFDSDGNLIR